MTRRLVFSYLLITVIVLVLLEIPLAVFYGQREQERFIADAERDAVVLATFYEDVLHLGFDVDPTPAVEYAENTSVRVVVVDTAGISVLDTGAEVGRDFSTRPEIESALSGTRSAGVRASDTLGTNLLYVAVPIASGGTVYGSLRLTVDDHEVTERVHRFWIGLGAVALVMVLAVSGIGWAIARSVTGPLRALQQSARRFARGDLTAIDLDADAPAEVAALGAAMNTMARRLDELISAQRSFVSDASHQLRTPLTALRLRLENLETRLVAAGDVDEVNAAIEEIERLSTLVNDLLQLARAQQRPPVETLDIGTVVADRVDTWTAMAADRGISLELSGPHRGVDVQAIPGAVEQLLDNTIDNALRASPSNGTVEITLDTSGRSPVLYVIDHGSGLSDDDKQRAMERFWRADTTTAGTGLGLSIAHSLIEASGGTLQLLDTPGGGLTIRFQFASPGGDRIERAGSRSR